jgi:hypothetical protein
MARKVNQWLSAVIAESEHKTNAISADLARCMIRGKGALAEKHLLRIAQREQILSEFARHVQESRAYQDEEEA